MKVNSVFNALVIELAFKRMLKSLIKKGEKNETQNSR